MEKARFEDYKKSADYIMKIIGTAPDIAVILGSGLGGYADNIKDAVVIPYGSIPGFPVSTVSYQKGELVYGTVGNKKVLAMNGRFHYYEGYEMWQTAYPIGVFKLLGVGRLIITNAAGGISEDYSVGDLVVVRDQIKFTSNSPLRGQNIPEFGERFFDMQSVYSKEMAELAFAVAKKNSIELKNGVYAYMSGPQYETPAEIKMLRYLGATLVGMSTVAEVIFAAQCRIPVLCISCVTNLAAGVTGAALDGREVVENGKRSAEKFKTLVSETIIAM